MAARSSSSPAGSPVTMPTSAGPWDSPAVVSVSATAKAYGSGFEEAIPSSMCVPRSATAGPLHLSASERRPHDADRRIEAGPALEGSGALRQENLKAVDDARAPCLPSRPHQRGLGTVLPVREIDHLVLRRWLEGNLVPEWRRVDEQGRVPGARGPFALGRDLPLRKERAQPDGERVRTLRVARRDRD